MGTGEMAWCTRAFVAQGAEFRFLNLHEKTFDKASLAPIPKSDKKIKTYRPIY